MFEEKDKSLAPSPGVRTLKVLITDDNVPLAQTLVWLVEAAGHEAAMCHDGRSAIKAAMQTKPDVIILDIGMPVLDGLKTCKALRSDPQFAATKIIAYSAWDGPDWKAKTREAGFDAHLVKPLDNDVFMDMLDLLSRAKS